MYAVIMTDGDYTSKPAVIAVAGSREDVIEVASQQVGDDDESVVMMRDELCCTDVFDTGHCAYHVVELANVSTHVLMNEIESRCRAD